MLGVSIQRCLFCIPRVVSKTLCIAFAGVQATHASAPQKKRLIRLFKKIPWGVYVLGNKSTTFSVDKAGDNFGLSTACG
jgi:hypothetical protein